MQHDYHKHQRRSKSTRVVALSLPPFVRVFCLLGIFLLLPVYFFFLKSSSSTSSALISPGSVNTLSASITQRLKRNSKHRLAMIIPFIGQGPEAIPAYLELFCATASGSDELVDFILFHNGVLDSYRGDTCPPNVKFISFGSTEGFAQQLVRVVDHLEDKQVTALGSQKDLARILAQHIIKYPYVLVEFKPALGYIFSEYLESYTHWGYSDLDILFGDMPRWITQDELEDFDIVTYGYGDQDRLYLRGQFTYHRNDPKINQLWRACEYLSHMDERFANVMSGKSSLHFESAEGCYSDAVMQTTDIRVKFTVKAFTDIHDDDTAFSHGLYVGTGKKKDTTVIYKAGSREDGVSLLKQKANWFESKGSLYADKKKPLLYEVGERERVTLEDNNDAKCMFWAQKKYQTRLCVNGIQSTETVFWIDGKLYKQPYQKAFLPGNMQSAPFFHFQEWKRYYRPNQLTGFRRAGAVHNFVLSKEGVLPLYPSDDWAIEKGSYPSPLGIRLKSWHGTRGQDRSQLPSRSYCLKSGPRKFPAKPLVPQCKLTTSWHDTSLVEVLNPAPGWKTVDIQKEVTMALTLEISASQVQYPNAISGLMDVLKMYLERWQGQPSVIVLDVAGSTEELAAKLRLELGPGSGLSSFGLETSFIAAIFRDGTDHISRKALLNMAVDAAPTRWVISGFELERGVVISKDAAFFAHRMSHVHEEMPGSVFIVPQFGLENQESDFSLSSVLKSNVEGSIVHSLHKLDPGKCEVEDDSTEEAKDDGAAILGLVMDYWIEVAESFTPVEGIEKGDETVGRLAGNLDDLQLSIMGLLTPKHHYSLYFMDVSPILMIDNMGPHTGMVTSDLVREVEEFAGKQCYNGLRLAQLATYGYNVNVLVGAFALSTPKTREAAFASIEVDTVLGESRCDGCFMFEEKVEDIIEDIIIDEKKRPAKAAILWAHEQDSKLLSGHT